MIDDSHTSDIDALREIMRALRAPVGGCPWDREQTFASIAPYTIEEAYEVADAIARDDMTNLREELGDLLLQVAYHTQMAEEADHFTFEDVVSGICAKMITRHPHVFGDAEERARGAPDGFWDDIKAREKTGGTSVLADVPMALPAIARAVKLQRKAARVGFDWPAAEPVFDKVEEELAEVRVARSQQGGNDGDEAIAEEIGDLMFAVVNLARHLDVDPETALARANAKFTDRFQAIEQSLAKDGRTPRDAGLDEMDAIWQAAKRKS